MSWILAVYMAGMAFTGTEMITTACEHEEEIRERSSRDLGRDMSGARLQLCIFISVFLMSLVWPLAWLWIAGSSRE